MRFAPAGRAGMLALAAALAGCAGPVGLDAAGLELAVPDGWATVAPDTWPVPGTPLAAWSGPGGASLVVYRKLPVPRPDAGALAVETVNLLANNPGVEGLSHRAETVAGHQAGRVELVAPGTGSALAPVGLGRPVGPADEVLVPTRRVVVLVPREADTIALAWHMPEADADARLPEVESTLAGLAIRSEPLRTSSY